MQRITHNGIEYFQFERFSQMGGVTHAIFTRRGGVSEGPYDSLNVGSTVGDKPNHVQQNRERMAAAIGFEKEHMRTSWQVHGSDVIVIRRADPVGSPPPRADAIVTDDLYLPLEMRFADCVPILFADPAKKVVGLAHAGWRGTVAGIGPATVRAMVEAFGCRPRDIIAGIGPSIGPCCYEVGPEVVTQVRSVFRTVENIVQPPENGHGAHLDLWMANEAALEAAGVKQIEVARMCTSCMLRDFYSHRAEAGRTGRFGAVIGLHNGHG